MPKGGRDRRVPMTKRLAALLAANRHLKGPRVLYRDNGRPATRAAIGLLDEAASRISGDILETEIAPKEKPKD